jgi:hypothetical protein
MAKRKAKQKTKPGPKPGQLSRLNTKLLEEAEVGLVQGLNPTVLSEVLAKENDVTIRTVERYFRLVRERWATEEIEQRPQRREQFRAMIMANWQLAYVTQNPMAGAATLRVLAKLDGLEAPSEIKITGAIDVRALSPKERRDKIEELLELRAKAERAALLNGANGKTKH